MGEDLRNTALFEEAERRAAAWYRPGSGESASLDALAASPDGRKAVAVATTCDMLDGAMSNHLVLVDLATGAIEPLTNGSWRDSAPAWSPDGALIAFLSDRDSVGGNCLRILDPVSRSDRATPAVDGFVEYLAWSPDGSALLLGVADFGSELAGVDGAFAASGGRDAATPPAWAPTVEGGRESSSWRSVWIYDLKTETARRVSPEGVNIWEAVWCGRDHIAAICSDRTEETWWYTANVRLFAVSDGSVQALFEPDAQLGVISVSPNGQTVAVIEAVCSDRNLVAGDVRLIDVRTSSVTRPTTLGADIVQLLWRNETDILFVAANGPTTVIGVLDCVTESARETWRGEGRAPYGPIFPVIAPLGDSPGDALFMCESFFEAPALIVLEDGVERVVRRLGTPEVERALKMLGSARDYSWTAPDGLTIHGWLLIPQGPGPHPLIMQVHGGPIWYARPLYLGRSVFEQMALAAGYALFQPNVRGSSGRGQDFAADVLHDMGGADTRDYLSGLDALQNAGIADPARIGVTGRSYGGFISAWLITQDQRFAAAVPVAPITDWVSMHLTSNIRAFCEAFLADPLNDLTGQYFTRSPIHHAHRVKTPVLNVCGAMDRITPPGQALEFHRAVQEVGTESVLVTYPLEGHGVRAMPAMFDFLARAMGWFIKHMPVD